MKENTDTTLVKNASRKRRISTIILASCSATVFTCFMTGFLLSDQIKNSSDTCTCIEVKEDEELNILQAMPFPLLPALDVAYSGKIPVSAEHLLLCSANNGDSKKTDALNFVSLIPTSFRPRG